VITPSQTVGPFFGPALLREPTRAIPGGAELVRLAGRVLDGDGAPVPDALVEFWRDGFVRVGTDDEGRYAAEIPRASYASVTIHARGLLNHLDTRVYFGEPAPDDPVWRAVPAARRPTLLARRDGDGYRWDVVLQGDPSTETVFLQWQR
jgi:protocatechuate 3,4-dioxygenase alpha subunit